jgi:iron complex transport system ATP-binding protein
MIKVENLSVRFGSQIVLNEISLAIPIGTWSCLVGPNGAGKTTFLRTLLGMAPYSGSIKINDLEIAKNKSLNIAFVPQRPAIPAAMSVAEYVMLGRAKLDGWGKESSRSRKIVYEMLDATQLLGMQTQLVQTLSGGEMQRVLIARALVQEPEIMLLDEPTSALDLHHQISVLNKIEEFKNSGTTIISTMHDITLGAMYAERIIVLQDGQLLLDGESQEVIHSPELRRAFDDRISVHTLENGRPVIVAAKWQ